MPDLPQSANAPATEPAAKSLLSVPQADRLLKLAPRPIPPPEISPMLDEAGPILQVAEVVRHSLHEVEYAVSPGGKLRALVKLLLTHTFLAAVMLGCALFLLAMLGVPLAHCAAQVCASIAAASHSFSAAATSMLHGTITLFKVGGLAIAGGVSALFLLRLLSRWL